MIERCFPQKVHLPPRVVLIWAGSIAFICFFCWVPARADNSRPPRLALVESASVQDLREPRLTLSDAIAIALQNNTDLVKAHIETGRAAQQLAAEKTRRYPKLTVLGLCSQLLNSPSTTFAAGTLGVYPNVGPIPNKSTTVSIPAEPAGMLYLSALQPLSTQYRLKFQIEALHYKLNAARESENYERLNCTSKVRVAYYQMESAQAKLENIKSSTPFYEETNRLAIEQIQHETILQSDLLTANAQLAKVKVSLNAAENELIDRREELNRILGRDIHEKFSIDSMAVAAVFQDTINFAEQRALDQNNQLKANRFQVSQAEFERRAKKAESIPDLSLSANYLSFFNFGSVLPRNILAIGLQLYWEPWDWGRKRHERMERSLNSESHRKAAEEVERTTVQGARKAWRDMVVAKQYIDLRELEQAAKRKQLVEIQTQVKYEKKLQKDLFRAQSEMAQSDADYQESLSQFWTAQANYRRALGEQ